MAISEVGNGTAGRATALSWTHGLTINSGDIILAFIHIDSASSTCSDNNGAYAFSNVLADTTPDSSKYWIWSRVAGASEPAAYAFTASSTSCGMVVRVFRGCDSVAVWDTAPSSGTTGTGTSNAPLAPSITTSTDGCLGILAVFVDSSYASTPFSSPTNDYGSAVQHVGGRDLVTYTKALPSAGAVGTAGCTFYTSDDWDAVHMALKPAVTRYLPGIMHTRLVARGVRVNG